MGAVSALPEANNLVEVMLSFASERDGQALAEATLTPNPQIHLGSRIYLRDGCVYRVKDGKYTWESNDGLRFSDWKPR